MRHRLPPAEVVLDHEPERLGHLGVAAIGQPDSHDRRFGGVEQVAFASRRDPRVHEIQRLHVRLGRQLVQVRGPLRRRVGLEEQRDLPERHGVLQRLWLLPAAQQRTPAFAVADGHGELPPAVPVDGAEPALVPAFGSVLQREFHRPFGVVAVQPERDRGALSGNRQTGPIGGQVLPALFAEVVRQLQSRLGPLSHLLGRRTDGTLSQHVVEPVAAELPVSGRVHGIDDQVADLGGDAEGGEQQE